MKTYVKFAISMAAVLALAVLLNVRLGQLPPLGKFLDPVNGVWQNALIPDIPKSEEFILPGLKDTVRVVFNKRGVPHIFASNQYDLFYTAGYVSAMHRLWQMEFGTHASTGRLSEILGEIALSYDRYTRRMGMTIGLEKMMDATRQDTTMMAILQAYSNGVNQWISNLTPRKYPFEYKLLDYAPEPWSPEKTLALGMAINRDLNSGTSATQLSYLQARWGREAILELYGSRPKYDLPIVPYIDSDYSVKSPSPPSEIFHPRFVADLLTPRDPSIGSNNWAVAGYRTLSGHPLLANDPHLEATLPSIWYEMQLNAPGINTYGVTFPGVPSVIIGFNEKIAWGNTNTGNDVFNLYEIEADSTQTQYLHDGKWLPFSFRIESYKVKGKGTVTDTIPITHHGPLMYRQHEQGIAMGTPVNHAISWTALESGNVVGPLFGLNTASNYNDFRNALSKLNSPAQNYVFASVNGDIAMQLNGLWPLLWKYQGMFVNDGRDSRYNWKGYIPFRYLPHELNPPRGYVSSANQQTSPASYPFYHGWNFANPARISTINKTLDESKKFTSGDMKQLQMNNHSFWAETHLMRMIDSVMVYISRFPDSVRTATLHGAIDSLRVWDLKNTATSINATIFDQWQRAITTRLWESLMEPIKDFRPLRPPTDISYRVLFHEKPAETYKQLFGELPNTAALLFITLQETIQKLENEYGPPGEKWFWWRFNGSTINHLLNIKALNQPRLMNSGHADSPNAIRNNHAPSWRMVVELSSPPRAWGVYPGGQSGNPANKGYNAFIDDWARGHYYSLTIYKTWEEAKAGPQNQTVILKPAY